MSRRIQTWCAAALVVFPLGTSVGADPPQQNLTANESVEVPTSPPPVDSHEAAGPIESQAVEPASIDETGKKKELTAAESRPLGQPNKILSAQSAETLPERPQSLLGKLDPRDNDITRVVGALAVVVGLILLLRTLMKRAGGTAGGGGRPSGVLEILARYPVARGQQVIVMKLARRILLVHQSGSTMTTLTEVIEPEEVASLLSRMESGASGRDAARFQNVLSEFEAEHEVASRRLPRRTSAQGARDFETEVVDLTKKAAKPSWKMRSLVSRGAAR